MAQPARNPNNLPAKVCPVCNRAFTWRKKWERDWDNVLYCSDRCRQQAPSAKDNGSAKNDGSAASPDPQKTPRRR